jgi:hypothetical protein
MFSSKRILATEVWKLAGISDPRTLAGLASLVDMKIETGTSDLKIEPEKVTGFLALSIDGEPVELEVSIRGKVVENIQSFLEGLNIGVPRAMLPKLAENPLIKPAAPVIMQPSPSTKPASDFLAPAPSQG